MIKSVIDMVNVPNQYRESPMECYMNLQGNTTARGTVASNMRHYHMG